MPASTAVGNAGIGSWIERRARAAPDAVALIAGDCSLTYSELAGRGRRLAHGLRTLGVAKGDRVAWLGPNHPAFLESLFAAGLLGAAMAPVNHQLDEAEISWILEDIKPRVRRSPTRAWHQSQNPARNWWGKPSWSWRPAPARANRSFWPGAGNISPPTRSPPSSGSSAACRGTRWGS